MALMGHATDFASRKYSMVAAEEIRHLREQTSPVAKLKAIR